MDKNSNLAKKYSNADFLPIDGMQKLIESLGGEEEAARKAIESSLFFHPEIVHARHHEMKDIISKNESLPARNGGEGKSGDTFTSGNFTCKIKKDGNGNSNACSVINNYTGYNLNVNLNKKPIQNYIISHLWGNATDPRYFTSLWNVILVPAWANHLLDKDEDKNKETFASRLKATFMKICVEYYGLNDDNWKWEEWDMEAPKVVGTPFNGGFNIQVISKVGNSKSEFGRIETAQTK